MRTRRAADLDDHPPVPIHSSVTATTISVSLLVSTGLGVSLCPKPNPFQGWVADDAILLFSHPFVRPVT